MDHSLRNPDPERSGWEEMRKRGSPYSIVGNFQSPQVPPTPGRGFHRVSPVCCVSVKHLPLRPVHSAYGHLGQWQVIALSSPKLSPIHCCAAHLKEGVVVGAWSTRSPTEWMPLWASCGTTPWVLVLLHEEMTSCMKKQGRYRFWMVRCSPKDPASGQELVGIKAYQRNMHYQLLCFCIKHYVSSLQSD